MAKYYGITRSHEYLAHYGIKGMRWGVRKAIEKGNTEALLKHYRKTANKLNKLKKKTNLSDAARTQYLGRFFGRGGGAVAGIQTGLIGGVAAADAARHGVKALEGVAPLAGLLVGPAAITSAAGGVAYLKGKKRMSSKGHAKNVQKVQEFASAAKDAFKNTPHEKDINKLAQFNDEYRIVDIGRNKKTGEMEARTISRIKGSHLTSDYQGKDKKRFMNLASERVKPFNESGIHLRSLETDADQTAKSHDPMQFSYTMNSISPKSQRKKMSIADSSREAYYDSLGKVPYDTINKHIDEYHPSNGDGQNAAANKKRKRRR